MPNEQGGYTAEEEAEAVQRSMFLALQSQAAFPEEQNPTPAQQAQQVQNNMATALQSPQEPQGILEALGYGFGPPYTPGGEYPENRSVLDPGTLPFGFSGEAPEGAIQYSDSGTPLDWQQYHTPQDRTTGGGFFTAEDLFGQKMPWAFQHGPDQPSTNNWRLLPPEYRSPNFIMRNGQIINIMSPLMYGPSGSQGGKSATDAPMPRWSSGAAVGYPSAYAYGPIGWAIAGWPGQLGGYSQHSTSGT